MSKPKAVLISDVHYSLATLELADAAMRQAIKTANDLEVPLIVCGDLHDSKANMRGECVNAMLETIKLCFVRPYILVGNHDKIHEKSQEHSLNFLAPYANIEDTISFNKRLGLHFIPYQSNPQDFISYVQQKVYDDDLIIAHQGLVGSLSGDYIQDKSAVSPDFTWNVTVISGHYHERQTIPLTNAGAWTYLGNPYTLGYGEANNPTKGYHILYNDHSLEFVPTNLRKHVVINCVFDSPEYIGAVYTLGALNIPAHNAVEGDLVWVKVSGLKEQLSNTSFLTKERLAHLSGIKQPFRLDLIPTDAQTQAPDIRLNLSGGPLIDSLVDSLSATSPECKDRLKALWKGLDENP